MDARTYRIEADKARQMATERRKLASAESQKAAQYSNAGDLTHTRSSQDLAAKYEAEAVMHEKRAAEQEAQALKHEAEASQITQQMQALEKRRQELLGH